MWTATATDDAAEIAIGNGVTLPETGLPRRTPLTLVQELNRFEMCWNTSAAEAE